MIQICQNCRSLTVFIFWHTQPVFSDPRHVDSSHRWSAQICLFTDTLQTTCLRAFKPDHHHARRPTDSLEGSADTARYNEDNQEHKSQVPETPTRNVVCARGKQIKTMPIHFNGSPKCHPCFGSTVMAWMPGLYTPHFSPHTTVREPQHVLHSL